MTSLVGSGLDRLSLIAFSPPQLAPTRLGGMFSEQGSGSGLRVCKPCGRFRGLLSFADSGFKRTDLLQWLTRPFCTQKAHLVTPVHTNSTFTWLFAAAPLELVKECGQSVLHVLHAY